jgi:hypothetical protein
MQILARWRKLRGEEKEWMKREREGEGEGEREGERGERERQRRERTRNAGRREITDTTTARGGTARNAGAEK